MAILTDQEFISYVGSGIVADHPDLATSKAAAEYAVQHHCHRPFVVAAAPATARVFTPTSSDLLSVDDISTTTDLVVSDNGVAVASTDYQLEPLNGRDYLGNVVPYTAIRRTSGAWYRSGSKATVSVTARWGWVAIPSDVVEATRVLGKDLAGLRDARFGVAGFGDFGVVRMRENPQVLALLAPYRRWDRAGIA